MMFFASFLAAVMALKELAENGQIAAQYADLSGQPSMDVLYNPSGSLAAVECVTSPDVRILGRMGHTERVGSGLYQNVGGASSMMMFSRL